MRKFNLEKMSKWWLFLYLPIYALLFSGIELLIPSTADYFVSYLPIDDTIPFTSWFVIFYVSWYIYLLIPGLYFLFKDEKTFKRYMYFIIIGFTTCIIIFAIFPNGQNLRPNIDSLGNDFCTKIVKLLYSSDTNTNVLPSMHVLGTMGVIYACFDSKKTNKAYTTIPMIIWGLLICLSTVFIKQHSAVDGIAGLLFSVPVYLISFGKLRKKETNINKNIYLFNIIMKFVTIIILLVGTAYYCVCRDDSQRSDLLLISILSFILLICLFIPQITSYKNNEKISSYMQIVFCSLCIIYFILNGKNNYIKYDWWINLMNILRGVIIGALSYIVIKTINNYSKYKLNLKIIHICVLTLCLSLTIVTLWDMLEFLIDSVSSTNMQNYMNPITGVIYIGHNALIPTMQCMFLNLIGIILAMIVSYFDFKYKNNNELEKISSN